MKSDNVTGIAETAASIGKRVPTPTVTADPHYVSEVDDLRYMIKEHEERAWIIGERVLQLREWTQENYGKPLSFSQLAKDLAIKKVKGNYLNRLALTAQMFPPSVRELQPLWSWFEFDKLRRAQGRQPKAKTETAKDRTASKEELIAILKQQPKDVRDFSNRQATSREKANRRKIATAVAERKQRLEGSNETPINKPHHDRWENVIAQIPNGTLDGMIADPPFPRVGNYYASTNTAYQLTRSLGNECDNADADSAIATTLALFDHAEKFTEGGFILLFQEGGLPLDPRILARAGERGWQAYRELHLIKVDDDKPIGEISERQTCYPTPSLMDEPFAPIEIKLTLFFRRGYMPARIGTRSNQNVFFFRSTSRRAAAEVKSGKTGAGYRHHFECPPDVLDELLTRLLHTQTKQLIFEPFGCTAPACVSAIRNGWSWIYCESNARNFERGIQRIEEAAVKQGQSLLFPKQIAAL